MPGHVDYELRNSLVLGYRHLGKKIILVYNNRSRPKKSAYLTFDIEDTESPGSRRSIGLVLSLLERFGLKGLFFVTGEMASLLCSDASLAEKLSAHAIGYHSSSHSKRPTILEYTDVENYDEALRISIRKESGPNSLTTLQELFRGKEIPSFRAPRLSWSPAHLAALSTLGIRFDFSTDISKIPVSHREITFFPKPIFIDRVHNISTLVKVLARLLTTSTIVLDMHPSTLMYEGYWDWEYMSPDVGRRHRQVPRSSVGVAMRLISLYVLFLLISVLRDIGFVQVTPRLEQSTMNLERNRIDISRVYRASVSPSIEFIGYRPKHWLRHFMKFLKGGS